MVCLQDTEVILADTILVDSGGLIGGGGFTSGFTSCSVDQFASHSMSLWHWPHNMSESGGVAAAALRSIWFSFPF